MPYRLGRKPPLFAPRHMRASLLVNQVLASFGPPPPASQDFMPEVAKAGGFRIFLNATLGCCTSSDCGNALIWRSAAAGTPVVPTDADILKTYEATAGYVPT